MKKKEVLDLLDRYPDEIDPESLIDALYLQAKLERAESDVAEGRTISQEEVVERSQSWFK